MRKIVILLIVATMLWGASARSAELFDALKTAEAQRKQGKLTEAFETLSAIDDSRTALVDAAFKELVEAFLKNRQSDNAAITARCIIDQTLRNDVLFDILRRQVRAAKGDEFDLMIDKAKKTAAQLTDRKRDDGYWVIAEKYASNGRCDLAGKVLKNVEDATRHDQWLHQIAQRANYQSLDREKHIRILADLTRSPLTKVKILDALVRFYGNPVLEADKDDYSKKRIEVLREIIELLLPLPDCADKAGNLAAVFVNSHRILPEAERENIKKVALEAAESIDDDNRKFNIYGNLSWPFDAVLVEKMKLIAEKTTDPATRSDRWQTIVRRLPHESEERKEAFRNSYQAALEIDDPIRWPNRLLELVYVADKKEVGSLLNEIMEILLSPNNETISRDDRERRHLIEEFIKRLADPDYGTIDQMLEVVHSPKIPVTWKQERFYTIAANRLLSVAKDSEFRESDCQKIFDLIESPEAKLQLFRESGGRRIIRWAKSVEDVLTIPDSGKRFDACELLANTLYRHRADTDVRPLLDFMERLAQTEVENGGSIGNKARQYGRTWGIAKTLSLWDERKIADWREQYKAVIAQIPDASGRFWATRDILYREGYAHNDTTAKNALVDKLLVAAREISQDDPGTRLNALWRIAQDTVDIALTERTHEIVDEALAFVETLSEGDRRVPQIAYQIQRIETLRGGHTKAGMERSAIMEP